MTRKGTPQSISLSNVKGTQGGKGLMSNSRH
jgi:hypothetical protein